MMIGLAILLIAFLAAGSLTRILLLPLASRIESDLLRSMLRKVVYILLLLVGVYLFLRISGLTQLAITVVSGTGLIGLILGFAFRDIAENLLASVLLSVQHPFRLGDVIQVDGHTGVVQKVNARETLLIDFDGNHIQIANATVYKNTIKNFTANPKLRINFVVGIGYDASIVHAQSVILDVLTNHSAILNDPEPLVLVEQFGSATVNMRVYFWIDGHEHSMLKMKSAAMRLTIRALERAGVSLPDESREVIFPAGVPVTIQEAQAPRKTVAPAPPQSQSAAENEESSESEGDLTSEVAEVEKQARESRDPDDGAELLTPPPN